MFVIKLFLSLTYGIKVIRM